MKLKFVVFLLFLASNKLPAMAQAPNPDIEFAANALVGQIKMLEPKPLQCGCKCRFLNQQTAENLDSAILLRPEIAKLALDRLKQEGIVIGSQRHTVWHQLPEQKYDQFGSIPSYNDWVDSLHEENVI